MGKLNIGLESFQNPETAVPMISEEELAQEFAMEDLQFEELDKIIQKQYAVDTLIGLQNYLHSIPTNEQQSVLNFIATDSDINSMIGSCPSIDQFDKMVDDVKSSNENILPIGIIAGLVAFNVTNMSTSKSRTYLKKIAEGDVIFDINRTNWRMLDYKAFTKIVDGLNKIKKAIEDCSKKPGKFDPSKIESAYAALGVTTDWKGATGSVIGQLLCAGVFGTMAGIGGAFIGGLIGSLIGGIPVGIALGIFAGACGAASGSATGAMVGDKVGGKAASGKANSAATLADRGWTDSNLRSAAKELIRLYDSCENVANTPIKVEDFGDKKAYFIAACKNYYKTVQYLGRSFSTLWVERK